MNDQRAFVLAAHSLKAFALLMMPNFECAPHHQLIIDRIEALLRGKIRKLAVIVPPRHGKTTLASILLPAYYLGQNPRGNVITASYGAELSEGWGRRVRGLLQDENFEKTFPNCILSPDSQAAGRFNTTGGGEYIATGRGGPITGRGADLLVLDDLIKDAQEANSDIVCRGITEWVRHVALTRLSRDGKILAISTRWSERDPMGWFLREQTGFEVVHLPAISWGASDALGRPAGEALWPSQFPLHVLESIRVAVGAQVWQSLYQGNPVAAQGRIFKRQWFRHYQVPPEKFQRIVMSLDTAFKTGQANDYSVATVWGQADNGIYLLHCWRDRVEFPDLKRQVAMLAEEWRPHAMLAEEWRPHAMLVEDKASGQSLIQELKTTTPFPVLPVKVDTDKSLRASAVTAFFEAGKIFFPEGAGWPADFEDELAGFPGAVHDDIVDSTTQVLNYLRGQNWTHGLIEYLKSLAGGKHKLPEPEAPKLPPPPVPAAQPVSIEQRLCPRCRTGTMSGFARTHWRCSDCGHVHTISPLIGWDFSRREYEQAERSRREVFGRGAFGRFGR